MSNSETIKLKFPFELDGETIEEITIRRPKIRDMERGRKHKDELTRSIHLLVDLTELTSATIRELDTVDFNQLTTKVGEFTGRSED